MGSETTSNTASQNFMVDLVTQLLLNASQITVGLAGVEKNESEVACIFHLHPYQHRASKKQRKRIN